MRIEIDTKHDSKEELQHLASFLMTLSRIQRRSELSQHEVPQQSHNMMGMFAQSSYPQPAPPTYAPQPTPQQYPMPEQYSQPTPDPAPSVFSLFDDPEPQPSSFNNVETEETQRSRIIPY